VKANRSHNHSRTYVCLPWATEAMFSSRSTELFDLLCRCLDNTWEYQTLTVFW
jgi:hypothetical protein